MHPPVEFDETISAVNSALQQGNWQSALAVLTGCEGPKYDWVRARIYRELGFQATTHPEAIEAYRLTWRAWRDAAADDQSPFLQLSSGGRPTRSWAIPAYISLLKHESSRIQWTALVSLQKMGPAAKSAIPALEQLAATRKGFDYYQPDLPQRVIESIRASERPNRTLSESKDFQWVNDQLRTHDTPLGGFDEGFTYDLESIWELTESEIGDLLDHASHIKQAQAVAILGIRPGLKRETLSRIAALIGDGRASVRCMALLALGRQLQRKSLTPTLEAELLLRSLRMARGDRSYHGQMAATEVLGWIGRASDPEAVEVRRRIIEELIAVLGGSDERVQFKAVEALGAVGKEAQPAMALFERLEFPNFVSEPLLIRAAAVVRIEVDSEKANRQRNLLIRSCRIEENTIVRRFALQQFLDVPCEKVARERVLIELALLDDDCDLAEFAANELIKTMEHEELVRLGLNVFAV